MHVQATTFITFSFSEPNATLIFWLPFGGTQREKTQDLSYIKSVVSNTIGTVPVPSCSCLFCLLLEISLSFTAAFPITGCREGRGGGCVCQQAPDSGLALSRGGSSSGPSSQFWGDSHLRILPERELLIDPWRNRMSVFLQPYFECKGQTSFLSL